LVLLDDVEYSVESLPLEVQALVRKYDAWTTDFEKYTFEAEKAAIAQKHASESIIQEVRKYASKQLAELQKLKNEEKEKNPE
jgi:outer membrane lipopolysaccharide assembly protein LptE/RlpB